MRPSNERLCKLNPLLRLSRCNSDAALIIYYEAVNELLLVIWLKPTFAKLVLINYQAKCRHLPRDSLSWKLRGAGRISRNHEVIAIARVAQTLGAAVC